MVTIPVSVSLRCLLRLITYHAIAGQWNPPSAPLLDSAPPESSHLLVESTYFLACNRNKRSCTINFRHPDGLEVLQDLIRKADVLVENFVPGKLAEMGLGWEDCQKLNDKLIYASISGSHPIRTHRYRVDLFH